MAFSRTRLALFALLIVVALVVFGFFYASSQKSHAAAQTSAAHGPSVGVKSIHSPDKVAIDVKLSAGQCAVRTVDATAGLFLPDPSCTPGAVDPDVTQDNLASTICKSGYTTTVRAPASDTDRTKALSLTQYGQQRAASTEYDHLISLQLGGTNAVSNLWPEPNRAGAPGTTNPKDTIETRLNKAVCSHKVALAAAQRAIATNWVTAEKDLGL
ncbi:hypothetical protein IV500_04890 [Paeniglutamicibacter antarcticus]|uniref:Uncharacterized protein n=1 Tax=Arthrobacter terrae TaxID=2935737 RepID=A0A931CM89_9MICC|nr:hypothetical protein [Arthrobacter terrae]MBG0738755.1 hypothetical protein [Arthrobacter terrae]